MADSQSTLQVNVQAEIAQFTASMQSINRQLRTMQQNVNRAGQTSNYGFGQIGNHAARAGGSINGLGIGLNGFLGIALGLSGVQGLFMGINHVLQDSTRVFMDFEQAIKNTQVIADGTAADFDKLAEGAKKLGSTTTLSATEVANAYTEMAKKGYATNDIIAAMPGIVHGAEASQEDLALVTDVATSALKSFNMRADETGKISDILAMVSNKTSAGVRDMQYAFKYAAPYANVLGLGVHDLAAMVGLLRDRGISAETAGTALRMMFTRMSKPVKQGREALEEFGVSADELSLKPVYEQLKTLEGLMANMTGQQKVSFLGRIFGAEAAPGVLQLIQSGIDKTKDLAKTLEDSAGTAAKQSKKMKDTFKADVEAMKGAWETFQISAGEWFADHGGSQLVERATDLLNKINEANKTRKEDKKKAADSETGVVVDIDEDWSKYEDFVTMMNFSATDMTKKIQKWNAMGKMSIDDFKKHLQESSASWGSILGAAWTKEPKEMKEYIEKHKGTLIEQQAWELETYKQFTNNRNAILADAITKSMALDKDEKALAMNSLNAHAEQKALRMQEINQEQLELMAEFGNQTYEQQRKTAEKLLALETEKHEMIIEQAAINQEKELAMLRFQADEKGKISDEVANKAIEDANTQFNETVNKANEEAAGKIAAATHAAQTGDISEETANKIIEDAERQRTLTLAEAKAMKDGYVERVEEMREESKKEMPAIKIPPVTGIGWIDSAINKIRTLLGLQGQVDGKGYSNPKTGKNVSSKKSRNAAGGIVSAPTNALIGEAGSEAIIPLSNRHRVKPFAQAVAAEMGTPQGGSGFTIQVAQLVIREEADIERVAHALNDLQTREDRARGVVRY